MSRSLRKGPYIQEALEKRILAMNNGSKKKEVVKGSPGEENSCYEQW